MSRKIINQAVKRSLSAARIARYEQATGNKGDENGEALSLYGWNAKISAAMMEPLHICEVVVRNAVSEAIEAKYGQNWPWSQAFLQSLPKPTAGYAPFSDISSAKKKNSTTGKVIPELKFVFWQKMFTKRYDDRIWKQYLLSVMPNLDQTISFDIHRKRIYDDLEQVRFLRNRIAHHEPVYNIDISKELGRVENLIKYRCEKTSNWMKRNQDVSIILKRK